ncbi:signal transduction histidine kinase [Microterricola gilva]|uniref:histidine kinase n=1 Tax=Microterricola gilva TaxID=393267 RepID=A0A4Q8ANS4_9MICO|nr:HAMP domain-containing sensor histidine kinase [Microterricola gilva]RZU66312.1 signal transduction histidine kinase [Microterricola gilva]
MTPRATEARPEQRAARPVWRGAVSVLDLGRPDRSIALTQLLFGAVVLAVFTTLMVFGPGDSNPVLFYSGILLAFVACCLAVLLPWSALPPGLVLLLPLLDIVAIGFLRIAQPQLGLGLLWVFPVLWVSTLVGVAGITASILLAGSFVAIDIALRHVPLTIAAMPALIFLPVVLIFIGASGYLTARRDRAQRVLLGKQAELLEGALAQARRQEELLAEVLNTVDFGVIRIDRSGQTTIVNEAQARLQFAMGVTDANAPVPAGVSVVAADRVTPISQRDSPLQRAMRGEEFEPVTVWIDTGNSDRVALSITARRLQSGNGEYDGSVVVSRDVTAEVAAVLARDDLIASVSHELRTPLTSILGYLELVIDGGDLPPAASSQLQIVYRNANRLLELVADILASSREAAQPMVLRLAPCALLEVVEQSVESLLPRAAERGIRLDFSAAEPTTLVADGSRLRQLIDNLLANAIKYNVEGGEVTIGIASDDKTVWLIVRDTGIGIADAEQPLLFDKFFRSESVRNSSVHGSGLGLGISREIARLHGGDLTVQSVEGEGTTVLVTLPKDKEAS